MILDVSEQRTLLAVARASIREALFGDGSLETALARVQITTALRERRGLFVTLKTHVSATEPPIGRLRGCVGTLAPERALVPELVALAPRAALRDPRFPALRGDELEGVRISLSILTPSEPLQDPSRLVIGEHGIQLEKEAHRAVFLPQVAVEQGWNVDQLLERLAGKAGLPADGWKTARLSVFRAEVFGESRE